MWSLKCKRGKPGFFLFIFLFVIQGFSVFGQHGILYERFTIDKGLPSNEVYWTLQDDNGDLWISTDNGIVKYNGLSMTVFTTEDGLPDNTVFKSYLDRKGRKWFSTFAGGVFWLENDKVHIPRFNDSLVEKLSTNWIDKIYVDEFDTVWMASMRSDDVIFKAALNSNDLVSKSVEDPDFCFYGTHIIKKEGEAMICQLTGYPRVKDSGCKDDNFTVDTLSTGEVVLNFYFRKPDTSVEFNNKLIRKEAINNAQIRGRRRVNFANFQGKLEWFSYDRQLYHFENNKPKVFETFPSAVVHIHTDEKYLIVCLEGKGIYLYDRIGDKIRFRKLIFESLKVSNVYKDHSGHYWLSTVNKGLYKIPSFDIGYLSLSENDLIEDVSVSNFFFYADTVRILENDTLYFYKVKRGTEVDKRPIKKIPIDKSFAYNPYRVIWDTHGTINAKELRWNYYSNSIDTILKGNNLSAIYVQQEKSRGEEVLFMHNGYVIGYKDGTIHNSLDYDFNEVSKSVFVVNKREHYVGALSGLHRYKDGVYKDLGDSIPSFALRIEKIQSDTRGNLLVSTRGGGIGVLMPDSLFFLTKNEGLSSNQIREIFIDDTVAYVATNSGLNKINFDLEWKSYKISHLLSGYSTKFNNVRKIFKDNGKITIQSGANFTTIEPGFVNTFTAEPKVVLENVKISGKNYVDRLNEEIILSHAKNNLNVEFRINTLMKESDPVMFQYRLKGIIDEWTNTFQNNLSFTNLPPNNYQFEILVRNPGGKWSSVPEGFSFTIVPPFYKRLWFIISVFILGLSIIIIYFRARQRRAVLSNELMLSNINALKNQMNPHFIFNSLNSIQYFIATSQRRTANIFLSKLSDLVRNVLHTSSQSMVNLTDEIERLSDYLELESMRLNYSFKYKIDVQSVTNASKLYLPPLLIQPIIENAIWHGLSDIDYEGEVKITFKEDKDILIVTVEDNGVGMNIDDWVNNPMTYGKGNSIGLDNIRQRIALLTRIKNKEYKISFKNQRLQPIRGTVVTLVLPQ